ncbi:MAG: hypothetical protein WD049_06265, partial [Candidatus Paceibacterota bacterium]
ANTGDQTLTNVFVSDPLPGLSAISPNTVASLAPLATTTFSATYVVSQSDIDDPDGEINNTATVTATDPQGDPLMDTDSETVAVALSEPPPPQLVQFITPMSVFRPNGSFRNLDDEPRDPNVEVAISGFKWHDVNQNGIWDAGELGRAGWRIYIEDVNGDNIFDPENSTEPFAITASDGSYVFTTDDLANLEAGKTYAIREDTLDLSAGTFQVQRFPSADPAGLRDPDEHLIEWNPGVVLQGNSGVAEAPNFGTFDYAPFIRPADEQLRRFRLLSGADKTRYLSALMPWQSIDISNTTSGGFNIVGFDTSMIAAPGNQFVSVVDASGNLIGPENPVSVAAGSSIKLYAFYDPAIRNGDTVIEQFPDWLGSKATTNGPHTFTRADQLVILTDANVTFPVNLVGGSTYDSDIFYDGAVDVLDLRRLNDELLDGGRNWPIVEGVSPLFDVTSDINARCPNGAEGDIASCEWGLLGSPSREIALGDFGTLNAEFDRARAPFLDLDPDNSSGAIGTDYAAEFAGVPIPVADVDASFANSDERLLLTLTVIAPVGDTLMIDESETLPGTIAVTQSETEPNRLVLTGVGASAARVTDFLTALSLIRYQPQASPVTRIAEITIVATGLARAIGNEEPQRAFTTLANESAVLGNTAVARITVNASN